MMHRQTFPPETIKTVRVACRAIALADAEEVFHAYARDRDVTRFLVWGPVERLQETRDYIHRCIEAKTRGTGFTWVLVLSESGRIVGAVDARVAPPKVEFGFVLARSVWGRGLMREVLTVLCDHALNDPRIFRVWATCDTENSRSVRVLESIGMEREGVLRRWHTFPNLAPQPRDCLCFSRVKAADGATRADAAQTESGDVLGSTGPVT